MLQLEYMRPEQLPENKGGRPPPEKASLPEQSADSPGSRLDAPPRIERHIRRISIPEGFPRASREHRQERHIEIEAGYVVLPSGERAEKLSDPKLLEQSPEQWIRERHPDWTEEEIA